MFERGRHEHVSKATLLGFVVLFPKTAKVNIEILNIGHCN